MYHFEQLQCVKGTTKGKVYNSLVRITNSYSINYSAKFPQEQKDIYSEASSDPLTKPLGEISQLLTATYFNSGFRYNMHNNSFAELII